MKKSTDKYRVIIADDHALVRAGIRSLLEKITDVIVVGEASDGIEALKLASEHKPDLILIDISMPEMNGIESTKRLIKTDPALKVIIISMYATEEYVFQALRAGAAGYLLKNARVEEMEKAIEMVMSGLTYLSPPLTGYVADFIKNPSEQGPLDRLTPRQLEILQLVAEGYSTKNVAAKLNISDKTVEKHRAGIMKAINAHDLTALVRFAIRNGIIQTED